MQGFQLPVSRLESRPFRLLFLTVLLRMANTICGISTVFWIASPDHVRALCYHYIKKSNG